ncbi:MAG: copper amine oxidase N-terminal domain-containing protein [Abitibacteriaceae bacterium]|nr:copper amine oxidase N-terminal domain-containing protein [Abditibacteriaceae bacterium]MBV9863722.1 copper amine oxidase N-terminal domain-containing protein [Abditibacteriaceae bacterium]
MHKPSSSKRQTKKLIGLAALAVSGSGLTNVAQAIDVQLNGQPLATSVAPIAQNGTTLVPMRDIFEALGATLNWNPATQTVTAQKDQALISLQINSPFATVNGQRVLLNQSAMIYGGRTMVPLRFVSEAMGAQVYWNNVLQRVSISTPNADNNGTTIASLPNPAIGNSGTGIGTGLDTGAGTAVAGARTISVPTGAVVPVVLDSTLSSATSPVGQTFTATVASQRLGDSEFPPGSKVEGMLTEARPRAGNNPGVLDFNFRSVVLPDGTRLPLRGELIALDNNNVYSSQGRLVAKSSAQSRGDRLKVIGVGAGAGFVLGRVLNTNTTVSTVLGAAGGYLFGRSRDKKPKEAVLQQGTRLGVRVNSPLTYTDATGYADTRGRYLRTDLETTELDQNLTADTPPFINARTEDAQNQVDLGAGPGNDIYPADNGQLDNRPIDNRGQYPDQNNNPNWDRNQDLNRANLRTIRIPAGVVVPVRLDTALSSANSQVGQRFTATVVSQQLGDSEFPPGSKVEGIITEARPKQGDTPGVLDMDFQSVILPDGTRQPLRGELIALDKDNVAMDRGRITAKTSSQSRGDRLKIAGIGAGVGFVLGRVLNTNSTVTTVLGGVGGYLFGRSRENKPREAVVPQGTRLGVRLDNGLNYPDTSGYSNRRLAFLHNSTDTNFGYNDTNYDNQYGATPRFYNVQEPRNINVPEGAVVPVTLDQDLSSATAQVGQTFTATVASQQLGDSEFPAGSKIEGVVVEAQPHEGDNPGVLDFDFRNVIFPDGTRQPLRGELISLDDKNVSNSQGRIVAKNKSSNDRVKVVGIGAGIGFVAGKLLKKNTTLSTILGGIGGYLYDQSKSRNKAAEALVPRGTRIGVRLDNPVTYADNSGYSDRRLSYLRQ